MKISTRSLFLFVALFCSGIGASHAFAQDATTPAPTPVAAASIRGIDPEKEKSIRELLSVMGAENLSKQAGKQIVAAMKQSMQAGAEARGGVSPVPDAFWVRIGKKFDDTSALFDRIIGVYDKHFSKEEIDGLIAFYKTPLGAKIIHEMPVVQQESMQIGQEWGRKAAAQIIADMEAEQAKAKKPSKPVKRTGSSKSKP